MTVKNFLIAYVVTAVLFLAMDATWLSVMGSRLYRPAMGDMMGESFDVAPALLFYAIYMVGVIVFAVMPGLERGSWMVSLGYGALLGLVAYATYDLTNQAVLKNWPWMLTAADLCWGTFATAVAAAISTSILPWVFGKLQ
jgi:uncharacterized membrane protein